jgi:WD40 repeat protein
MHTREVHVSALCIITEPEKERAVLAEGLELVIFPFANLKDSLHNEKRYPSGHIRTITSLRSYQLPGSDRSYRFISTSEDSKIFIFESIHLLVVKLFEVQAHLDSVLGQEIFATVDSSNSICQMVLSCGRDYSSVVWDPATGDVISKMQHRNNSWLTCAAVDKRTPVLGIQTEDTPSHLADHYESVTLDLPYIDTHGRIIPSEAVQISPVKVPPQASAKLYTFPIMATGDEEGRVSVWDNCSLYRILRGHASVPIQSLEFFVNDDDDPDGVLLLTGCKRGLLIIWKPLLGVALHSIDTFQTGIGCIRSIGYRFPRSAKFVYVSGLDGSIKLFDIEKGRPLSIIISAETSPRNQSSNSKEIILFDTKKLELISDTGSSSKGGNFIVTALNPHLGLQLIDIDPVLKHWLIN